MGLSQAGIKIPNFWLAIQPILTHSVKLKLAETRRAGPLHESGFNLSQKQGKPH